MNMHTTFNLLFLAIIFTHPQPTYAQSEAQTGGAGTMSCGDYISYRKKERPALNALYVSWLLGYVSAYNQFSPNKQVHQIPSSETLLAFADRYCKDNPLPPFKHVADTLIIELGGDIITKGKIR